MDFTIPTTDNWQDQLEYIATKEGTTGKTN